MHYKDYMFPLKPFPVVFSILPLLIGRLSTLTLLQSLTGIE
jgi:hypothetical protein